MWERGRMGGAGKKPTGWESDLPRASQSVGGRSSFTDPGWDVLSQEGPGMSELSLFLYELNRKGAIAQGRARWVGRPERLRREGLRFPLCLLVYIWAQRCVWVIAEMHSWWLHLQS